MSDKTKAELVKENIFLRIEVRKLINENKRLKFQRRSRIWHAFKIAFKVFKNELRNEI